MKIKEIKEELIKSLNDIERFEMFAETKSHRSTDIKKLMKIINILDTVVDTIKLHLYRYKLVEIDDQHFMFLVYPNDYTDNGDGSDITIKLFQSLVIDVYITYRDDFRVVHPTNDMPLIAIDGVDVEICTYTASYMKESPDPIDQIDIMLDTDPDYPFDDPDGNFFTGATQWEFDNPEYAAFGTVTISEIKELYDVLDRILHE